MADKVFRHGYEPRHCCDSATDEPHEIFCNQQIDPLKQEQSFLKDPERWIDGYTNHTATALARRAAAPVIDFENTTMAINDNHELKRIPIPKREEFKTLKIEEDYPRGHDYSS